MKWVGLDGVEPGFSSSDADGFLDVGNEDLSIADAAGLRGTADSINRLLDQLIGDDNFNFYLGKEINDVFRAAVELRMTLLASEALGLGHRDALKSDLLKRFFDLVELEWLDDRLDFLH